MRVMEHLPGQKIATALAIFAGTIGIYGCSEGSYNTETKPGTSSAPTLIDGTLTVHGASSDSVMTMRCDGYNLTIEDSGVTEHGLNDPACRDQKLDIYDIQTKTH